MATTKKRITQKDFEALANFRYALRRFFRFSEEAAIAAGLTPQQYQALLAVRGFPGRAPVTVGDLAERLQFRPHSAVALVNRMVQAGLVVRTPSPDDRRQVYVSLTEQGEAALEELAWVHREELRRLEPHMSDLCRYLQEAEAKTDGGEPDKIAC